MTPLITAAESAMAIGRERLIAICRALIAAAAWVAMWFDPTEPARLPELALALGSTYAVYALAIVVALQSPRRGPLPQRLQVTMHVVDMTAFAVLAMVTDGAASPYVLAYVFVVAAAALRWQWRGTLWTVAIAFALLVLFGGLAVYTRLGAETGPERLLVRGVLLLVVALLVGYLGMAVRGLRARILSLAGWPTPTSSDVTQELPRMLEHAAAALGAQRLLLAWEDPEEPLWNLVQWDGQLQWQHEEPERLHPLTAPGLEQAAFAVTPGARRFRLLVEGRERVQEHDPLPPWVRACESGAAAAAVSVPLRGETLAGRFYALGLQQHDSQALALGMLLAERLARSIDQLELFERFHRQGLARERQRLARDLHDGVIQSLAAAGVRLEAAGQMCAEPAAAILISQVQEMLQIEQRALRHFLGGLESDPAAGSAAAAGGGRAERMRSLVQRVQEQWNLQVELQDGLGSVELPHGLDHELSCLVLESLINAARHGRARRAWVRVGRDGGTLSLRVGDDGCGFGFEGRVEAGAGAAVTFPESIRRRVSALEGTLALESGHDGAVVDIELPHRPVERLA